MAAAVEEAPVATDVNGEPTAIFKTPVRKVE